MFEEFHITFDLSLLIFFGYASVSVRQYKELTSRSIASHKRQTDRTFILPRLIKAMQLMGSCINTKPKNKIYQSKVAKPNYLKSNYQKTLTELSTYTTFTTLKSTL